MKRECWSKSIFWENKNEYPYHKAIGSRLHYTWNIDSFDTHTLFVILAKSCYWQDVTGFEDATFFKLSRNISTLHIIIFSCKFPTELYRLFFS